MINFLQLLSPHFSLGEMVATQHREIDNTPDEEIVRNLTKLCTEQLEPARVLLHGLPMLISSGYRCHALNEAVGGAGSEAARRYDPSSKPSDHLYGLAADFICPGYGDPYAIGAALVGRLPYRQLIVERSPSYVWVHIAHPRAGEEPLMQSFNLSKPTD